MSQETIQPIQYRLWDLILRILEDFVTICRKQLGSWSGNGRNYRRKEEIEVKVIWGHFLIPNEVSQFFLLPSLTYNPDPPRRRGAYINFIEKLKLVFSTKQDNFLIHSSSRSPTIFWSVRTNDVLLTLSSPSFSLSSISLSENVSCFPSTMGSSEPFSSSSVRILLILGSSRSQCWWVYISCSPLGGGMVIGLVCCLVQFQAGYRSWYFIFF